MNNHTDAAGGKFSYFKSPVTNIRPHCQMSPADLHIELTNEGHKYHTDRVRQLTTKAERAKYKQENFPIILPTGIYTGREAKDFQQASGFFIVDIDNQSNVSEISERFINDTEIRPVLLFISPSGNGIKAMYKTDVSLIDFEARERKLHRIADSFNTYLSVYYRDIIKPENGFYLCGSTYNLVQPCFICHDPNAYFNSDETSIIDDNFYKDYYRPQQRPDQKLNGSSQTHGWDLPGIAARHLPGDCHHQQLMKFFAACNHFSHDKFVAINFVLNSNKISPESSYFNNEDQLKSLADDIYKRYKGDSGDNISPLKNEPPNFETLRQAARIDLNDPIIEPPVVLQVIDGDNFRRFASLGDFSMVQGKAKSKKSFFVAMLVAACLNNNKPLYNKINPILSASRRNIVVFDTEQAKYDVQLFNQRVMAIGGLPGKPYPYLDYYHLKRYDTAQRMGVIEHTLYNTPGIVLAVIDGVRDLITDINDPQQATFIADKLMKWVDELNIHIVVVLHENKGDTNARGHVGTELTNKAETVVSINKSKINPEISTVVAEQTRGTEFKDFAFLINALGLPEIVDLGIEADQEPKKKTIYPNSFPPETHKLIVEAVFKEAEYFKYKDIIEQIKAGFRASNVNFGNSKAREFLTHWLNNKWVVKGKQVGLTWEVYRLTQVS
jgi:hypothetical protein